ncbi:MAG: XdhC/CoxI family protein [Clostridia bacterium]|nr:XdhC/CoxI family protein [Clostridia bacterium]
MLFVQTDRPAKLNCESRRNHKMRQLFTQLKKKLEQKQDTVFVTVVASSGATPRAAGARMLVGREGRLCGTIGGGAVEHRAEQLAREAIEKQTSGMKHFSLTRDDVENLGMICGGDVTLFFRCMPGGDERLLMLCNTALEQFALRKTTWLVTELTDAPDGNLGLYSEKLGLVGIDDTEIPQKIAGQTCRLESAGRQYLAEELLSAGYVYIFGGGHVAQELAPLLAHLDFRCIVLEDRPEFAQPALFPCALSVKQVDFSDIHEMNDITDDDYIVIMTRGHASDQIIQEQALRTPAGYIGVIGSNHKKAAVQESIMSHGFTQEDVKRIVTPIGLLGVSAETPAEIAVSIAGQLIAFRAGAGVVS